MKKIINKDKESFINFEDIKHIDENGYEYWNARELMEALEYSKWSNFVGVIDKAKIACKLSKNNIDDHFADVGKKIKMPKGASKVIEDYELTRYACYLIAQNGDPRKESIALAQTYFAVQTRKQEISEKEYSELTEDEKRFYQRNLTKKVKRGKDPNKKLSTNNYLSSLTVNNGLLSPVFNKEKVNYIVYLPFEIDNISVSGTVEDTVYGILKVDGPSKLNVGVNTYKLTVTAEDESTRVYTVNVIRGRSLDSTSTNTYLKELTLTKGKLKGKFNKETYVYYYSKSKGFSVNALAEDETSEVSIKYVEDIVIITVSDSANNSSVYVLLPKENNLIMLIIVGILVFSIGTITGIGITKIGKKGKKKALAKK